MHGYGASREVRVDEQGLEREMSRDKLINSRVQQVTQVDATRARASRGLCGHDCREEEARVIEPMNDATGSMYSSPNTSRQSTFSARQEQVTLDCLTRCFAMSECKFGMLDFASNVAGQHCSNIAATLQGWRDTLGARATGSRIVNANAGMLCHTENHTVESRRCAKL